MYVIELHDDELENAAQDTRAGSIGRHGTIEYDYQVEAHLQDILDRPWRRAYLKAGDCVRVVWVRDMATGEVRYLARSQGYTGEWKLPFVGAPDAQIAVGVWGHNATTYEEGCTWASQQLANAATAILLEQGEICFAWEMVDGAPQLISRGPSRAL